MSQYLLLLHESPADYADIGAAEMKEIVARYTTWARIIDFYKLLLALDPSAPPRLGHAIALAEGGDAAQALALLQGLLQGLLAEVPAALRAHAHAALAHVMQRLGRSADALGQLGWVIALARRDANRRLLQRRAQTYQASDMNNIVNGTSGAAPPAPSDRAPPGPSSTARARR